MCRKKLWLCSSAKKSRKEYHVSANKSHKKTHQGTKRGRNWLYKRHPQNWPRWMQPSTVLVLHLQPEEWSWWRRSVEKRRETAHRRTEYGWDTEQTVHINMFCWQAWQWHRSIQTQLPTYRQATDQCSRSQSLVGRSGQNSSKVKRIQCNACES